MRCTHCGGEHESGVRFCPVTGKPVSDDEAEPMPTQLMEAPPFEVSPSPSAQARPAQHLGPQEILRKAIDTWKAHWVQFLAIAAVAIVPVAVVDLLLKALTRFLAAGLAGAMVFGLAGILQVLATALTFLATALLSALLYAVAIPMAVAATLVGLGDVHARREVSWSRAWSVTWAKVGPVLITQLLVGAVVLVGTVLCVIPGLVASFFLAFTPVVVMVEGLSGQEAMKRSYNLVMGDWANLLVVLLILLLAALVLGFVAGLLFKGPFASVLSDLLMLAVVPFFNIALAYAYTEARCKLDGLGRDKVEDQWSRLGS